MCRAQTSPSTHPHRSHPYPVPRAFLNAPAWARAHSGIALFSAVQAKRWRNNLGNFAVQAVHAGKDYYGFQRALLITTSYLTRSAKDAAGRLQVAYMEAPDVQAWLEASSLAHILRK